MNRLTKAALIAASAILVAQAARAGNTDLVLAFTPTGAGTTEADIDLGSAAQVGIGGSSVVDLIDSRGSAFSATGLSGSGLSTLLTTAFGSTVPNGADLTLAGGQGGSSTFFYLSANRGAAGSDPTVALSSTPFAWTKNQQGTVGGAAAGVLNGNSISFQGGNAAVSIGTSSAPNTSSFSVAILGVNSPGTPVSAYQTQLPDTAVSAGKAFEDIWYNNAGTGWHYQGYLTLDLSGGTTEMLTFTPAASAVPEPSTYGLVAGLGLLAVAFRRQFVAQPS